MKVFENQLYKEDVKYIADLDLPWNLLKDSSILISGASGLVGSCLIDAIMHKNMTTSLNCKIYALGRNEEKTKERFQYCWDDDQFLFVSHDINLPLEIAGLDQIGYVLHMASNTHPVAYATDPIGTVTTNIIGTYNMLEFAVSNS